MLSLSTVKSLAIGSFGRTGLVLQKNAPTIMLVTGVTGVVVGTILACKATLKADQIIKEAKETFEKIENCHELPKERYSDQDYQRDLAITYTKTCVNFVKLYGPAFLVIVASLSLIVGGHHILTKRNAALAAAYKLVDEAFKEYRNHVRKEYGDDVDRKFRFEELAAESNSDAPLPWEEDKELPKATLAPGFSMYGRLFSKESARQYQKSYELNEFFLRTQQNFSNDMLRARGHLFLNEVYDVLGMERSKEGAIVGWVKGHGDDRVDFNYLNPGNERNHPSVNQPWYLDFNVDGVIYDMI